VTLLLRLNFEILTLCDLQVIPLPCVLIVGLGQIKRLPRFASPTSDVVVPAKVMTMSVSADHRVLDGATVARFASEVKSLLEEPGRMLAHLR